MPVPVLVVVGVALVAGMVFVGVGLWAAITLPDGQPFVGIGVLIMAVGATLLGITIHAIWKRRG